MKILFTGGGTGGHFYPLIAVAEELNDIFRNTESGSEHRLYFMAPKPYDKKLLEEQNIEYVPVAAGKVRRYFSLLTPIDFLKTVFGFIKALWKLFLIYPDVVFAKGAYGSFPVLMASRILRIPVILHESDAAPGRTNKWASGFATRIAVSYKQAAKNFPVKKVAYTGQPLRKNINLKPREVSFKHFGLSENIPVILVLGGSQGARNINTAVIESLPKLLDSFYVLHQAGEKNTKEVTEIASVLISQHPHKDRYKLIKSFSSEEIAYAAGAASLIISRAGSTIFEIAEWGIPSIIIPISDSNADHQIKNAYAYAATGAASVIEEKNLSETVLMSEINRIINKPEVYEQMSKATKDFVYPDAAKIIAEELYRISKKH